MKLKCHRAALASAVQVLSGVVPSRTPKEILKNIKLDVSDGLATLVATDQEVGIRYELAEVEADSAGEALLPTNRVASILRELQEDAVDIEVSSDAIWIRSGHSEFRLSAEDPAEFPSVAGFDEDQYYVVPAKTFKEMIRRTQFAADVESTRYALGGILIELGSDSLVLAATDSRRLAVIEGRCTLQGGEDGQTHSSPVVPSKAMTLMERSLPDDDQEVRIAVHTNDVLVKSGPTTIYSRLVEGRYPQYRDVIPNESHTTIELVVGPFYSAVRQAQIVTNEESRGVDFQFSKGLMTLISRATDVGESKVELPVSYDREELTITFDPRYVADFLRVLDLESQIRLELINSESAAVFRTDESYTYVVMPLSRDR